MSEKRMKHFLGILAISATSLATASEAEDAIAACARISSTGDRILCLENALRSRSTDAETALAAEARPEHEVVPAPVTEEQAAAEVAAPVAMIDDVQDDDVRETAEPAVVAADDRQDSAVAGIGAEQVEARSQSREEMLADLESVSGLKVASYTTVPYDRLVVELENGQVWRQIKGDIQQIRASLSRNQTVDISESQFGGYQLRLNEMRRTVRVERIR